MRTRHKKRTLEIFGDSRNGKKVKVFDFTMKINGGTGKRLNRYTIYEFEQKSKDTRV